MYFIDIAAVQSALRKRNIYAGAILWLDEDAGVANNLTWRRSVLASSPLDHPDLVVDSLRDDHNYLWICTMSGTCNSKAKDIPVALSSTGSGNDEDMYCLQCERFHVYDFAKHRNMLYQECHFAMMGKLTHVSVTKVYDVSPRMLRLERDQRSTSGWKLDSASILRILDLSQVARARLAASSHAVQNSPLPPIIDFNQPGSPYVGSDVNPNSGTYSSFFAEKEAIKDALETSSGDCDPTLEGPTGTGASSSTGIAVTTTALFTTPSPATVSPGKTTVRSFPVTAVASPSVVSRVSPETVIDTTGAKANTSILEAATKKVVQGSSSKPSTANASTPSPAVQRLSVSGTTPSTSSPQKAKRDCAAGALTELGPSLSALSCVSEEKKAATSSSETSSATAIREASTSALKTPAVKLDPTPAGASVTQQNVADDLLTRKVAAVDSSRCSRSGKLKTQLKQPSAASTPPKAPAAKPTHPFNAGQIVWVSRREYEDENYNPLEHLRDITNRPACVLDAEVPGRPDHVYICGVSPLSQVTNLATVSLSEVEKGNYLAIATGINPNPTGMHKVKMMGGRSMPRERRVSYINANKQYIAPAQVLDKMRESTALGDHRLDEEGVKKLKEVRAVAIAGASRL